MRFSVGAGVARAAAGWLLLAQLLAGGGMLGASALGAQDVPPTLPPIDTLLTADTLPAAPREVRNLMEHPRPPSPGFVTGVWEWNEEGLLSARALTLLELLEEIPGVVPLRGGDYGQPSTVTAFGLGGGRVRVFLDGVEMPPVDGGAVDLSRVGLGGIGTVRVERRPGELRVELFPLRFSDARPLSLLEVGTGDLNTNLFRGTFAHPFLLGSGLTVSLDRIDTEGPFGKEPGVSFGAHLRHTLFAGARAGLAWELRQRASSRPSDLWAPARVDRRELALHGRYAPAPGILAGAFVQRSSLRVEEEGGVMTGLPEALPVDEERKTAAGVQVSGAWRSLWARIELRRGWGRETASSAQSLAGGAEWPGIGGASGFVERETRAGVTLSRAHARVWTERVLGVSIFGEVDAGRRHVPVAFVPPEAEPDGSEDPDPPTAPPSVTDRTGYRVGAHLRAADWELGVAAVRTQADSLHPIGLPFDRGGIVLAGGRRWGLEATARVPLSAILDGLELQGSAQRWDAAAEWRYLPRRIYQLGLRFHDVFLETGNLEVWSDVAVRGRDPMQVPLPGTTGSPAPVSVPFQQSWFARVQVRVVSVRVFVLWENFTVRERNQDYPGRILPPTRALYGIRWTLWD